MEVKQKTFRRDEWPEDEHKNVLINREIIKGKNALVGLVWWKKNVKPVKVSNKTLKIVDEDYTWLELAIAGESYWVTAMYDENDEFIEAYFDLSKPNNIDSDNPILYDMFTDIIISSDLSVHILDEDELDDAITLGLITNDEYEHIKKTTKVLYEYIVNNTAELLAYFKQKQRTLKEKMKENVL